MSFPSIYHGENKSILEPEKVAFLDHIEPFWGSLKHLLSSLLFYIPFLSFFGPTSFTGHIGPIISHALVYLSVHPSVS